ncbi:MULTISPECIES: universal stress protein [Kitasatospora]|uniref:universal stress protein n=1 Tax=Kitasatospora TaxID=2063 RepID=UPI000C7113F3|nr:universal stress protein [Kitasatospora sp. GP30]MDH6142293.1 nucleotide-binding universal stress UspA family protein [Kitasatospora sp. GP30]
MTRRIVVGVDGSLAATAALRWAVRQAAATGVDAVEAVNAWELSGSVLPPPVGVYDPQQVAANVLHEAVVGELGETPEIKVTELVLPGPASAALLGQASGAELLVVGSRGLGGFGGLLLGSVSRHVVEHAPCPVVVVRAEYADGTAG